MTWIRVWHDQDTKRAKYIGICTPDTEPIVWLFIDTNTNISSGDAHNITINYGKNKPKRKNT